MIPHERALGISEDLVKISDRNLIHFFWKEIRDDSMENVPTGARRRLKRAGIIRATHNLGVSGSGVVLTPYGEALLKEDPMHPKSSTN